MENEALTPGIQLFSSGCTDSRHTIPALLLCEISDSPCGVLLYNTGKRARAARLVECEKKGADMPFRSVGNFFRMMGDAQRIAQDYERLNAMSTEQLASRGLKRSDLARHVYNKHSGIL